MGKRAKKISPDDNIQLVVYIVTSCVETLNTRINNTEYIMIKKLSLLAFMVSMCLLCFLNTHNNTANAHPKKIIEYSSWAMDACSIHDYPI